MKYQNVEQFLQQLRNFEKTRNANLFKEYSLEPLEKIWKQFISNNQKKNIRISVVGTNGKGSVSHYLHSIAIHSNLQQIGLYTSPHLERVTERIVLSDKEISETFILDFLNTKKEEELQSLLSLSYFEFFTLLAKYYFQSMDCKLEIYEAGLGGRLDATKLAQADYVIVTKIAMDHSEILGNTLEEILEEKLQICTNSTKAIFTMEQDYSLLSKIDDFGKKYNKKIYKFTYKKNNYLEHNYNYANYILQTLAKEEGFQLENIFTFSRKDVIKGRMEILREDPILLYDVGHNPDAIFYLSNSLEELYPTENWTILLGSLKDKDIVGILHILTNWKNTKKIYRINSPDFHSDPYEHPILENLPIEEISSSHMTGPTLVCGGFRLYPTILRLLCTNTN